MHATCLNNALCTIILFWHFLNSAPLSSLSSSSPSSAVVPVQVCVEYEVLSYLHRKGLPVPKPYHLESREGVIGTEFFIMEYVDVSKGVFLIYVPEISIIFIAFYVVH